MAQNHSEEINFQHYVDLVKQHKFPWNIFIDVMQDLSYSDRNKLRILNAILLKELTMDYSDMDKLKYLNGILLREFKNYVHREQNIEMTQIEDCKKSVDLPVHEEDEFNNDFTSLPKEEFVETITSDTNSEILESNYQEEKDDKFKDHSFSLPIIEETTETDPIDTSAKTGFV